MSRGLVHLSAMATVLCATPAVGSPGICTTAFGDFTGHDILPSNPPATANGEACCAKCAAHPGCVAFSFKLDSGTCYLKSAAPSHPGGLSQDRLSGWVNSSCSCTAPDPAPPPCWATPHPCKAPQPRPPSPGPPSPPRPKPAPPPPGSTGVLKEYRCLAGSVESGLPFCNQRLPLAARVEWIVANLSVPEMVAIVNKQPVGRLNIPGYAMWQIEGLHGVRLWPEKCPFPDRCTTIFPTASTGSRAFNTSLWQQIGQAMGTEGRVLWNLGITSDLSLRGPQVNIQRDPRWGRNSNSPSEDPMLTGVYGMHLVLGTQTPVQGVNLINSQMKHWTAYGVESNRMGFNGNVSIHDMAETYMEPLHWMLKANVSGAMCAYDAINGTPSCANGWMSNSVLRQHWGFDGVIESDCGALSNIQDTHHYAADKMHAAAAAMNGTCDVECDSVYSKSLLPAFAAGIVSKEQLANAARRILRHRFTLGLFDDPRDHPYFRGLYNVSDTVHSDLHARLAREAAQQGVVVVQNPGGILPLSAALAPTLGGSATKFAVIGPLGNITDPFLGDYRPAACPGPAASAPKGTACKATLLALLAKRVGSVVAFASGCVDPPCKTAPDMAAVGATMAAADVIILAVGEKTTDNDSEGNTGGEGRDRDTIGLPGSQAVLVAAAIATKKPVVVVILSGGSVSIDAVKGSPNVAVVYPGFGGESGEDAIVDVLFGDAPATGRLPFTVYPESWGAATAMKDMSFQAGQGRSYKYLRKDVEPLYEFGAGLAYTTFELAAAPSVPAADIAAAAGPVALGPSPSEVCVSVTNTGRTGSPVVVMLFAAPVTLSNGPALVPNRKLIKFDKVAVAASAIGKVCFGVTDSDVALVDDWTGTTIAYAGQYDLVFYDGASKVTVLATVADQRTVWTVPAVDNPTPPCCSGTVRSCC